FSCVFPSLVGCAVDPSERSQSSDSEPDGPGGQS
ncbi:cDNA sequence BC017643, isoform CRA_b, partial [Mus musculus]